MHLNHLEITPHPHQAHEKTLLQKRFLVPKMLGTAVIDPLNLKTGTAGIMNT